MIILVHHSVYAENLFKTGVKSLLVLRSENVFWLSHDLNKEKRIITTLYLTDHNRSIKITQKLRLYIKEASPRVALPYINEVDGKDLGIQKEVFPKLRNYITWLKSL